MKGRASQLRGGSCCGSGGLGEGREQRQWGGPSKGLEATEQEPRESADRPGRVGEHGLGGRGPQEGRGVGPHGDESCT